MMEFHTINYVILLMDKKWYILQQMDQIQLILLGLIMVTWVVYVQNMEAMLKLWMFIKTDIWHGRGTSLSQGHKQVAYKRGDI